MPLGDFPAGSCIRACGAINLMPTDAALLILHDDERPRRSFTRGSTSGDVGIVHQRLALWDAWPREHRSHLLNAGLSGYSIEDFHGRDVVIPQKNPVQSGGADDRRGYLQVYPNRYPEQLPAFRWGPQVLIWFSSIPDFSVVSGQSDAAGVAYDGQVVLNHIFECDAARRMGRG